MLVCFIGGIIQVVEVIRAEQLIALDLALGIARIVFAGLIGWICGFVISGIGWHMMKR